MWTLWIQFKITFQCYFILFVRVAYEDKEILKLLVQRERVVIFIEDNMMSISHQCFKILTRYGIEETPRS